tara:strand:+ start:26 stop:457 length:432 start_codon:yes stop_codon:yes gene_type:complete
MSFEPNIESRKEYFRDCKCGREHENKFIRGMFNYSEEGQTIFCAALLEHSDEKHIWLSFLTGEWPNTGQEDCAVTCHIFLSEKGRHFSIANGEDSPFEADDVFECYQVTREQVLAVDGAKDWFIETYLALFEHESEIGNYLGA